MLHKICFFLHMPDMILRPDSIKETFIEHISGLKRSFECLHWKDDSRVLLRWAATHSLCSRVLTSHAVENCAGQGVIASVCSDQWRWHIGHWRVSRSNTECRQREASQEDKDGKLTFLCISWDIDPFHWWVGHLLEALMGWSWNSRMNLNIWALEKKQLISAGCQYGLTLSPRSGWGGMKWSNPVSEEQLSSGMGWCLLGGELQWFPQRKLKVLWLE